MSLAATRRAPAPSAAELVARARDLAPLLAAYAAEAETLRRPPDAVIQALVDAEIFRLMVPRAYGGCELDLDSFLEVGLALSEGDASLAWVATFYIEHNWILCQFPETFQRALYADNDAVLAPGMLAPNGRGSWEGEHYRVAGRWPWATGVMHASWVLAGGLAEGGPVAGPCFLALPMSDVRVEDTWFVDGMVGTGSNDVVVDGARVPPERSVSLPSLLNGSGHGAALHGPLYRTPMMPILCLAASLPAVGQARVAARAFEARIRERMLGPMRVRQSDQPAAQMRLARVDVDARRAEALLRDTVAEVCALRDEASLRDRARWAVQFSTAVQIALGVLRDVVDASGASAHFAGNPQARALRDLQMLAGHTVFDHDARLEAYGRTRLGLDPATPVL